MRYKPAGLNSALLRKQVFARDAGICLLCGIDAEALRQEFYRALMAHPWEQREIRDRLERLGFHRWHSNFWEVDHLVAIVEGGALMDLENCRSLCEPCHRRETRLLYKRLRVAGLWPPPKSKANDPLRVAIDRLMEARRRRRTARARARQSYR